jgi:hypothetical protein
MNGTNRFRNRAGLLLLGLVLLAIGGAVVAARLVPEWASAWADASGPVADSVTGALDASPVGAAGGSWLLIAVAVVCAILASVLVVLVLRQGGGRTRTIVRGTASMEAESPGGGVVIESGLAKDALTEAIGRHPAVASVSVTAYAVRRTPALKISAQARRGASIAELRAFIDGVVGAWDAAVGTETPIFIEITSRITSRFGGATRTSTAEPSEVSPAPAAP